jgi:hypothetical protein
MGDGLKDSEQKTVQVNSQARTVFTNNFKDLKMVETVPA